jgi:hypothetical protein
MRRKRGVTGQMGEDTPAILARTGSPRVPGSQALTSRMLPIISCWVWMVRRFAL